MTTDNIALNRSGLAMKRQKNIYGGGAKTNLNGLKFEAETSLLKVFSANPQFSFKVLQKTNFVQNIYLDEELIGYYTEKHDFYKYLEWKGVHWNGINSKKYLPDSVFINEKKKKIFVVEKKFQEVEGSVDEKLQTCHFKKKVYQKLISKIVGNYSLEYYYLLNSFFEKNKYDDVKAYIQSVGCKYFIGFIEFEELGIEKN